MRQGPAAAALLASLAGAWTGAHPPGGGGGRAAGGGGAAEPAWLADLVALPGEHVVLRVPPGAATRPEMIRLARELDAAAAAMRPLLPAPVFRRPLLVAVEEDFAAQGRHAGRIGEAVPGRAVDLHLVYHPGDLFAYRFALAERLLAAHPPPAPPPPVLARGAALWLAGDWYGRPWPEWLPALAAAGAFPTAGELLAGEEAADGSVPLWTPPAAAVVARLPGATVAEKFARPLDEGAARTLLAAAAAAARARPLAVPSPPPPPGGFLRGVSVAMHNSLDGGYHAPAIEAALDRLSALGASAVSLMPFAYQRDPHRPGLEILNAHPASETDVGVIHAARRARARGLAVLWKPHLWVSRSSWPGDVQMGSERDWVAWFASYRRYVLHHAFLAAWAGADLFCAGVELDRTAAREAEWRELLAAARRLYPGPITYAANWYGGAEKIPFWDAVDRVGVDAYYPLAAERATPAEVAAGAARVAAGLAALARGAGKPLLLTEVGFAARRAAWATPHLEGGELSEADQAAAYRAFLAALGRPDWLAGAFVWKAFSGGPERLDRPDFRFVGRPAEAEVRRWFAGSLE